MKKVSKVFLTIFAIGVILALLAGALALPAYIVAMFIGGETATAMCETIYTECFPYVIQVCSVATGFGLIGMYLSKTTALTIGKKKG